MAPGQIKEGLESECPFKVIIVNPDVGLDELVKLVLKIEGDPELGNIDVVVNGSIDSLGDEDTLTLKNTSRPTADKIDVEFLKSLKCRLMMVENQEDEDEVDSLAHGDILIIEDSSVNRLVLTEMLEIFGHSATCVVNGEEGIKAYESSHYKLVLLDLRMPVMDGYETAQSIRKIESLKKNKRTPIIAVTADDSPETRLRVAEADIDGFIQKPIDLLEIEGTIKRWVQGKDIPTGGQNLVETNKIILPAEIDDAQLFDRNILEAIKKRMGEQRFSKILETILEEIDNKIVLIEDLIKTNDRKLLDISTHGLKGEAAAIGAVKLERVCKVLEKMATHATAAELLTQLDVVKKNAENSSIYLQQHYLS